MADFPTVARCLLISLALIYFSAPTLSLPRRSRHLRPPARSSRFQAVGAPRYSYETRYFDQNLDHFSFSDVSTFRQRYLINTQYWVGPERMGPIFLYCGNEGDIDWFAANTGFVWEIAPRFGAMIVFPEHRYYGESMPYGSKEVAYKNATTLALLTAEQALADFAVLITELKRNLSAQACPVVLFGGSYGGMLAAWMRLKYPHIAIGALASSAPILQFEDVVPPETFYDIVSNDFRRESISCFNTIKASWNAIEMEAKKDNGLSHLTETFRFCKKLESADDLTDWLESAYSYLAMANYPYPADFLMPMPGNPIKEVCRRIDNSPNDSILQRIFEGVTVYYNYTGTVNCFDLNDDPHGMSGWDWQVKTCEDGLFIYLSDFVFSFIVVEGPYELLIVMEPFIYAFQACTEMVMPTSSSRNASMFPPYDYDYSASEEWCLENYHVKPRPTWITTEFGGHGFKNVLENFGSNIIFSNGLLDPWSGGSVLESISESIVALVTEKGAHHLDLRPATGDDPMWLLEQRTAEVRLIQSWLEEYYKQKRRLSDM